MSDENTNTFGNLKTKESDINIKMVKPNNTFVPEKRYNQFSAYTPQPNSDPSAQIQRIKDIQDKIICFYKENKNCSLRIDKELLLFQNDNLVLNDILQSYNNYSLKVYKCNCLNRNNNIIIAEDNINKNNNSLNYIVNECYNKKALAYFKESKFSVKKEYALLKENDNGVNIINKRNVLEQEYNEYKRRNVFRINNDNNKSSKRVEHKFSFINENSYCEQLYHNYLNKAIMHYKNNNNKLNNSKTYVFINGNINLNAIVNDYKHKNIFKIKDNKYNKQLKDEYMKVQTGDEILKNIEHNYTRSNIKLYKINSSNKNICENILTHNGSNILNNINDTYNKQFIKQYKTNAISHNNGCKCTFTKEISNEHGLNNIVDKYKYISLQKYVYNNSNDNTSLSKSNTFKSVNAHGNDKNNQQQIDFNSILQKYQNYRISYRSFVYNKKQSKPLYSKNIFPKKCKTNSLTIYYKQYLIKTKIGNNSTFILTPKKPVSPPIILKPISIITIFLSCNNQSTIASFFSKYRTFTSNKCNNNILTHKIFNPNENMNQLLNIFQQYNNSTIKTYKHNNYNKQINNKYFNNDMQSIQFSKYETLFNKWKDKMIKEQKRQRRYKNIEERKLQSNNSSLLSHNEQSQIHKQKNKEQNNKTIIITKNNKYQSGFLFLILGKTSLIQILLFSLIIFLILLCLFILYNKKENK